MPEQWIEAAAKEICNLDPLAHDHEIAAIIQRHYDIYIGSVFANRPTCGELSCDACDERTAALYAEVERLKTAD